MTRNRDDFTTFEAFRAAIVAVVAIIAVMAALGSVIASHKQAAELKAAGVAASAFDRATSGTEFAAAERASLKG